MKRSPKSVMKLLCNTLPGAYLIEMIENKIVVREIYETSNLEKKIVFEIASDISAPELITWVRKIYLFIFPAYINFQIQKGTLTLNVSELEEK